MAKMTKKPAMTRRTCQPFFVSPFYNQGDHLHGLLTGDKNLDDAAQLYIEQKDYFSAKRDKHRETLELLARQLNEPKKAALQGAISGLNGFELPAPVDDWFAVRKTIHSSESTIEAYPSHEILEDPEFLSPKFKRLEQTIAGVKDKLIPSSIEGDSFRGFPNGKKSESMRRTDTEVRYGQSGCVTGRF